VFALVCLGLALALAVAAASRGLSPPGRTRPLPMTLVDLAKVYGDPPKDPDLAELWRRRHQGRFVEWTLTLHAIRADGSLAMRPSGDTDDDQPLAVLVLVDPQSARNLDPSDQVPFSASLDRYDGLTFFLRDGVLLEDD
jgi:hypothetical protein